MCATERNTERIVLIGAAGALGALSRYGLQGWVNDLVGRPTVLGTLAVNILGALVLGLFLGATEERFLISGPWRTVGSVGFLGAFTTFSTLMFESAGRIETGDLTTAFANLAGSVALGMIAVFAGLTVGRAL